MPQADSIDKIVRGYLGSLSRQSFSFHEQHFTPMPVVVSPLLFRGFTCPESCGGCCGKFTLDWLPHEYPSAKSILRTINVNGADFRVFTDSQRDNSCRQCRHLHRQSGRCKIYAHRPFTCDFELIRVLHYPEKVVLTQKLYGRGWAMTRVTGEHGAACQMQPADAASIAEVERKLLRLNEWAEHFGVTTCLAAVIDWVRQGNHQHPLSIPV